MDFNGFPVDVVSGVVVAVAVMVVVLVAAVVGKLLVRRWMWLNMGVCGMWDDAVWLWMRVWDVVCGGGVGVGVGVCVCVGECGCGCALFKQIPSDTIASRLRSLRK